MKNAILTILTICAIITVRADYEFSTITNAETWAKVTSKIIPDGSDVVTVKELESQISELDISGWNSVSPGYEILSLTTNITEEAVEGGVQYTTNISSKVHYVKGGWDFKLPKILDELSLTIMTNTSLAVDENTSAFTNLDFVAYYDYVFKNTVKESEPDVSSFEITYQVPTTYGLIEGLDFTTSTQLPLYLERPCEQENRFYFRATNHKSFDIYTGKDSTSAETLSFNGFNIDGINYSGISRSEKERTRISGGPSATTEGFLAYGTYENEQGIHFAHVRIVGTGGGTLGTNVTEFATAASTNQLFSAISTLRDGLKKSAETLRDKGDLAAYTYSDWTVEGGRMDGLTFVFSYSDSYTVNWEVASTRAAPLKYQLIFERDTSTWKLRNTKMMPGILSTITDSSADVLSLDCGDYGVFTRTAVYTPASPDDTLALLSDIPSVVEPSSSATAGQAADAKDTYDALTRKLEINDLPVASTNQAGIVQLSSATDSDNETMAATPKALKTGLDGKIDMLPHIYRVSGESYGTTYHIFLTKLSSVTLDDVLVCYSDRSGSLTNVVPDSISVQPGSEFYVVNLEFAEGSPNMATFYGKPADIGMPFVASLDNIDTASADLVEQIYDAVKNIAPAFTSKAYAMYDLCSYNGALYRCKVGYTATASSTPPAVDTTHWEAKKVSDLFLPLTGGTMSGDLIFDNGVGDSQILIKDADGYPLRVDAQGIQVGKWNDDENRYDYYRINWPDATDNGTIALVSQIYAAVQQIAPEFDATRTFSNRYRQYALCSKDGVVYQCTNVNGHYGAWNASNWEAKNVSELFVPLTGGVNITGRVTFSEFSGGGLYLSKIYNPGDGEYTLPYGKTGTVALTSDIPSIEGVAPLSSPEFTGTPTAPDIGTNTTSQIATKNYVDSKMSLSVATFGDHLLSPYLETDTTYTYRTTTNTVNNVETEVVTTNTYVTSTVSCVNLAYNNVTQDGETGFVFLIPEGVSGYSRKFYISLECGSTIPSVKFKNSDGSTATLVFKDKDPTTLVPVEGCNLYTIREITGGKLLVERMTYGEYSP